MRALRGIPCVGAILLMLPRPVAAQNGVVTGFTLWDAETDTILDSDFSSGETIDVATDGECVAIEVNTNAYLQVFDGPGSVAFSYDGAPFNCEGEPGIGYENFPPYAWEGENGRDDFFCAVSLTMLGPHTLSVTPYDDDDCMGARGTTMTLDFEIINDCGPECEPACGNSVEESGEECDDGNISNRDSCLNNCTEASCGDGFVWRDVEPCDDGNVNEGDSCLSTCQRPDAPSEPRIGDQPGSSGCGLGTDTHSLLPWLACMALFGLRLRVRKKV